MTEYCNFWIRIENRADGLYVRSDSTAGGSVAAPLDLPADLDAYQLAALLRTARGASRGTETQRDMAVGDEAPAASDDAIGGALFHALFPGPVRDAFMRSSGSGKENGVRVRIQIDPTDPTLAKLAGLPWELLYNDVTGQSLGRSKFTPIVRSLDVAQPYAALPFEPPLRVLLVLANPSGTHALGLDREKERIAEILGALDGVEVDVLENATKPALYDKLDVGGYHVLHYMGHGGFDPEQGGVLFLEDEAGGVAPLSARLLGDDLAERRDMRLVFLNACDTGRASAEVGIDPFTGVASALVAAGIPAVVAMQVPIADSAAFEFAEKFYAMIAHGEPVDASVAVGRRAIYRSDPSSLEWATPILFMRSDDGQLFSAPETEGEPPETPASTPAPVLDAPPPVAPRPPAEPSGGSKVLRWAAIGGGVLVALFVLFLLIPSEETASAAGIPDDVWALMEANGLADPDDDFVRSVAQRMVDDRAEMQVAGFDLLTEQILRAPEGQEQLRSVAVEPGVEYLIRGYGDEGCDRLGVTVLDEARTVMGEDAGAQPSVRIPGVAQVAAYEAEMTLEGCSDGEGFAGLSVYGRDVPLDPDALAPEFSADVQALLETFGDPSNPDPEFLRVAQKLVEDRATAIHKGFEAVSETIVSLPRSGVQRVPVMGEPDFAFMVVSSCDGDCEALSLGLYDAAETRIASDSSKTPAVRITVPPVAGTYAVEVALDECTTPECFVAIGVYCKAPPDAPPVSSETSPPSPEPLAP